MKQGLSVTFTHVSRDPAVAGAAGPLRAVLAGCLLVFSVSGASYAYGRAKPAVV